MLILQQDYMHQPFCYKNIIIHATIETTLCNSICAKVMDKELHRHDTWSYDHGTWLAGLTLLFLRKWKTSMVQIWEVQFWLQSSPENVFRGSLKKSI